MIKVPHILKKKTPHFGTYCSLVSVGEFQIKKNFAEDHQVDILPNTHK